MITLDPRTDLSTWVGREVAVSDWLEIAQAKVDEFADATFDQQWIHVDPERAARESPFGGTIAHGFLTLSLLSHLYQTCIRLEPRRMGINVGFNRVRFTAPVKVGTRIRARFALDRAETVKDGLQFVWKVTIESEDSDKPACVAEWVTRALN
ncbi:MAG: MaoC family dehydratase [Betaproteobacteria bacterium]|nr:MaoC family dehydratase [Betaproteobacteria bacterium]